jgi:hypothetical protein
MTCIRNVQSQSALWLRTQLVSHLNPPPDVRQTLVIDLLGSDVVRG